MAPSHPVLYAGMYDGQLLELASSLNDLTEMAKTVLRDELRKRGLDERRELARSPLPPNVQRANYDLLAGPLANSYIVPSEPTEGDAQRDGQIPLAEYTWKTLLCECDELIHAEQIAEVLRRARIESWIEAIPSYGIGLGGPRVLVAADQLDQARAIIANPIPQDIIDESLEQIPEYAPPVCPSCGTADPILVSTEPSNSWECETCGKEWTDPVDEPAETS